jgi:hypothetical protein
VYKSKKGGRGEEGDGGVGGGGQMENHPSSLKKLIRDEKLEIGQKFSLKGWMVSYQLSSKFVALYIIWKSFRISFFNNLLIYLLTALIWLFFNLFTTVEFLSLKFFYCGLVVESSKIAPITKKSHLATPHTKNNLIIFV